MNKTLKDNKEPATLKNPPVREFHAHLYYGPHNLPEATELAAKINRELGLVSGRLHQQPVGPHPVWSCGIHFPVEKFAEVVQWLMFNRGTIDVFVHPDTGDDPMDHSARVIWLGRSYELKMEAFNV